MDISVLNNNKYESHINKTNEYSLFYYILLGIFWFTPFYPVLRRYIEINFVMNYAILGAWIDISIILLCCITIYRLMDFSHNKPKVNFGAADYFFMCLALWAFVSIISSDNLIQALYGYRNTYLFIWLYFSVMFGDISFKQFNMLKHILVISIAISALFGIILYLVGGVDLVVEYQIWAEGVPLEAAHLPRSGSTFLGCHQAAPAFILLAMIGLSDYLSTNSKKSLWLFILGLISVILTLTRGAMGSLLIGGFLLVLAYYRWKIFANIRALTFGGIALLILLPAMVYFPDLTTFYLTDREGDWIREEQAIRAVSESINFPFGHATGSAGGSILGAENLVTGSMTRKEDPYIKEYRDSIEINVSDNYHLKILYELGYPGIIFWGLGLICVIIRLLICFLQEDDPALKSFLGVAFGYSIAISIYCLSANQLEIYPTKIYFWSVIGLALMAHYSRCNQIKT